MRFTCCFIRQISVICFFIQLLFSAFYIYFSQACQTVDMQLIEWTTKMNCLEKRFGKPVYQLMQNIFKNIYAKLYKNRWSYSVVITYTVQQHTLWFTSNRDTSFSREIDNKFFIYYSSRFLLLLKKIRWRKCFCFFRIKSQRCVIFWTSQAGSTP